MGSPITLSGFNNIDFNLILNAIMQQERQPVVALQSQKSALEAQQAAFGTLASRLASLESAARALTTASAFSGTTVTVSDTTRLAASGSAATAGSYEIYVDALARAQVTTSATTYADRDTTIVAGAGTLRLTTAAGSVDVVVAGDVTLEGLAAAINDTADTPVSATIVRNASGQYQLVLTGVETGAANGFTIDASGLGAPSGGGSAIAFNATNVQEAADARVRVNGVEATSASNRFEGVINGLTFDVLKQDPGNPVTITITASSDSVKSLVEKLVAAFNDATRFIGEQTAAAARGESNNVGRDALVRGLRTRLTSVLTARYDTGGAFTALAEIGFEFQRSGELTFNAARFEEALASGRADVERLFRGTDGSGGVFGSLVSTIGDYTKAGGLVPDAQDRLGEQVSKIAARIAEMEERLAIRRAALQEEFIAADLAIAQLNAQQGQLGQLGGQYRLF